jgi:hypothetical protein
MVSPRTPRLIISGGRPPYRVDDETEMASAQAGIQPGFYLAGHEQF